MLYYVCNTALFGIVVKVGKSSKLSVYVDSHHDGNVDDRKSISGYVIYLGVIPIVWRSIEAAKRRSCRTREAEYIALSACINEVVWFQAFLRELGLLVPLPVP